MSFGQHIGPLDGNFEHFIQSHPLARDPLTQRFPLDGLHHDKINGQPVARAMTQAFRERSSSLPRPRLAA